MKRSLKLAVLVGGIGALAWGMRNRIRIAIGRGEQSDPDFHIIEPVADSTADQTPSVEIAAEEEPDGDSGSASDDDSQTSPGAADGVS